MYGVGENVSNIFRGGGGGIEERFTWLIVHKWDKYEDVKVMIGWFNEACRKSGLTVNADKM